MKIVDQKNFAAGLFYLVFGVAVAIGATQYQIGTAARMGPGYFPLGLGIALSLTGLCVLAGSLATSADSSQIGRWPLKSVVIILTAVVLFGVLLEPMGLVVAVPVLIGVSSLAHEEFSWRTLVLSILVLLPLTWLIFVFVLGLQFPVLPHALGL